MSSQTWLIAILIVLGSAIWYGLMAYAIRDLAHRPRVRGGNKVLWGLFILCVPVAGAIAYSVYGPTSFRDRPPPPPADPERRRGLPLDLPFLSEEAGPNGGESAPPRRARRRSGGGKGDA